MGGFIMLRSFESYEEAFEYWLENQAEQDEYEQGMFAQELIKKWLREADIKIQELEGEL